MFRRTAILLPALAIVAACSRSSDAPKVPLAQAQAQAQASSSGDVDPRNMPPVARAAIDSGNAAYRAKNYDKALIAYRAAAVVLPNDVTPYFGVYMVAQKTGNKALADSAMLNIKRLSGDQKSALTDTSMQSLHAGLKAKHP